MGRASGWKPTATASEKGDWKPLADFYTEDATYGWNIGPKEDVMCVGRDEIRDVAWVWRWRAWRTGSTSTRRCSSTRSSARSSASGSRSSTRPTARSDEIYGIGGSWFRLNDDLKIEWQRDFFDFGHVSQDVHASSSSRGISAQACRSGSSAAGRRESARLLPARRGTGSDLVTSRPSSCLGARVMRPN